MFTSRVTKKQVKIQHIPALLFEPIDQPIRAHIIHYHGWGSRKENHAFIASAMAAKGFAVLVPDALYHGQRGPNNEEGYDLLPHVVLSNLEEFPLLSSYLNAKRIFLSGHSMGSMSAGVIFHQKKEVEAAAIINGYLSYKNLDLEIPAALLKVDPTDFLEDIGSRHLLILHGDADSSVDIQVQRDYVKKAHSYYEPGHLIMEEISRLDHYITLWMLERTINFFLSL
ncbi:MAG: hypothetical protein GX046_09750 [Tissierellia bacterium]|nr:hypothetical protein [Tissierellia bacterium]